MPRAAQSATPTPSPVTRNTTPPVKKEPKFKVVISAWFGSVGHAFKNFEGTEEEIKDETKNILDNGWIQAEGKRTVIFPARTITKMEVAQVGQ